MNTKHWLGWKTNKKIIVIESDDWGSFRFKNQKIRDKYIRNYSPNLWMHFNDSFESFHDLFALSEVLNKFKKNHKNKPCLTFLFNPANPDFKKIEQHHFKKYYYTSFNEVLRNRDDGQQIYDWYIDAIKNNMVEIGFHGREHLNVKKWMRNLYNNDNKTLTGFKDKIWGQPENVEKRFRSTFDLENYKDLLDLEENIIEGVNLIDSIFNQKTKYFLPPDGPYHLSLNKALVESGIEYIGLPKLHSNPLEKKWYQKKISWLGKSTKEGLIVITRNVTFEPASPKSNNWIKTACENIEIAFKHRLPAVISTHRANYVGSLNRQNRINSLTQLESLLEEIYSKWPDVEFMTSSQLGLLIKNSK